MGLVGKRLAVERVGGITFGADRSNWTPFDGWLSGFRLTFLSSAYTGFGPIAGFLSHDLALEWSDLALFTKTNRPSTSIGWQTRAFTRSI